MNKTIWNIFTKWNVLIKLANSLLLFALYINLSSPAIASSHLQNGINNYNQGKYLNALHELIAAVSENNKDATAHYYMANTLTYLNQEQDAQDEYKIAYVLAPAHSQLANYCRQAILGRPDNNSQFTHQMVQQFRNQLKQDKELAAESGHKQAEASEAIGRSHASAIQNKAAQDIANIRANPNIYWGWGGGGIWRRRYMHIAPRTGEIEAIRQKADADSQWAIEMSKRDANNLLEAAKQKEVNLEESASNLESQFLGSGKGGAKLSALGTNLYIRNYSYDDNNLPQPNQSNNQPTPLLAKAKQLNLRNFTKASGNRANMNMANHSNELAPVSTSSMPLINTETKDTTTGVKGKVINP